MKKITSHTQLDSKPNVHIHSWISVCQWSSYSLTL